MSAEEPSQSSLQLSAFISHPSVSAFQVHYRVHLSTLPNDTCTLRPGYIATGALTFDSHSRILLIQRASTDSMPNLWEIPGGGCDEEDPTILYGLTRELYEEAGLIATKVGPLVGKGHVFATRGGKVVCKYNFVVEIDAAEDSGEPHDKHTGRDRNGWVKVRLDPTEHQNYVWATEEEVRTGKLGGVELKFTKAEQKQVILDAFQVRKVEDTPATEAEGTIVTG